MRGRPIQRSDLTDRATDRTHRRLHPLSVGDRGRHYRNHRRTAPGINVNHVRRSCRFHFVDVFAIEPLTGNPLAVVEDAADLTVDQLQRIARKFNQSETTSLLRPTRPDADWRLRSVTAATQTAASRERHGYDEPPAN